METAYLSITDDFDARHVYRKLQFYSRDAHNSNKVRFGNLKSDNVKHEWEEETLEFLTLGTEVKLTFYSFPCENPKGSLARHTLEIEISGEEQARRDTIRKLEVITGIKISKG